MTTRDFVETQNPGSFVRPQWLINPVPGKTWVEGNDKRFLLVMSGNVACHLRSGDGQRPGIAGQRPTNQKVRIMPRMDAAFDYAWRTFQVAAIATAQDRFSYRFEAEQFATLAGLASFFNKDHSVNARYAATNYWPLFSSGRSLAGIELDLSVGDSDAEVLEISYHITATGRLFRDALPPIQ